MTFSGASSTSCPPRTRQLPPACSRGGGARCGGRPAPSTSYVVEAKGYRTEEETAFLAHEAFVRAAKAALDAAEDSITRLTLLVESSDGESAIERFLSYGRGGGGTDDDANVVGALVSHQAVRRVEELRVAAVDVSSDSASLYLEKEIHRHPGLYGLASLPSSATLRVLDLTRCTLTAAAFALPRLRYCAVETKVLQAMLDAAPELATVRLESLGFLLTHSDELDGAEAEPAVLRLSFQTVTTLVMSLCGKELEDTHHSKSSWVIEIDAPRLQSFKYKGLMRRFRRGQHGWTCTSSGTMTRTTRKKQEACSSGNNFTNARTLKLRVGNDLKDIAAIGEPRCARLPQCVFPSLQRLELEGTNRPKIKTAAVAIANLLNCCPALGEIMLKLSTTVTALPRLDYSKSIEHFMRLKGSKTALDCVLEDVPDIPGLSGRSFACLQRTLRRVSLQFRLDNNSISSCLGLRIIKFFVGHASVLEEICVDTGNWRLNEHLSFNVKTQIALAPVPISAITYSI